MGKGNKFGKTTARTEVITHAKEYDLGRKPKDPEDKLHPVRAYHLTNTERKALTEYVENENISANGVIRNLLVEELKKKGYLPEDYIPKK